MNFDPYAKTNSKWIIDLSVKSKIIKLLYENIGENLCDLVLGKYFLAMTPKEQSILFKKNNELDFINITNTSLKDTVTRIKRQTITG